MSDYPDGRPWFWWAVAGVFVLIAVLAFLWLIAQLKTDRTTRLDRSTNARDGYTTLHARALTDAVAHEAVGRARRRPGTANLVVTLEVDPPSANLVIEDDAPNTSASAAAAASADRAMHERAVRLGARFSADHRVPTGTRICVTLGGTPP